MGLKPVIVWMAQTQKHLYKLIYQKGTVNNVQTAIGLSVSSKKCTCSTWNTWSTEIITPLLYFTPYNRIYCTKGTNSCFLSGKTARHLGLPLVEENVHCNVILGRHEIMPEAVSFTTWFAEFQGTVILNPMKSVKISKDCTFYVSHKYPCYTGLNVHDKSCLISRWHNIPQYIYLHTHTYKWCVGVPSTIYTQHCHSYKHMTILTIMVVQ